MDIKYICLSAVITFVTAVFCSCSSGSEGSSKAVTTVILIFLFLAASLCSAVLTFKLRRKKELEKAKKSSFHNKKE